MRTFGTLSEKKQEALNGQFLSLAELELLNQNPLVNSVDSLGFSGIYSGCYWYSVELKNGKSMDVYTIGTEE